MKDNSLFLNIKDKKFLIDNIQINDNEVSYDISCLQKVTNRDKQLIDEFVKKLISGEFNVTDLRKDYFKKSYYFRFIFF